jgi:hypothetical protein
MFDLEKPHWISMGQSEFILSHWFNLKTAKALRLTSAESFVLCADEVIE